MFHSSRVRRLGSAALVVSTMSVGLAACGTSSKSGAAGTPKSSAGAATTAAATSGGAATSAAGATSAGAATSAAGATSGGTASGGTIKKGLKIYFIPKDTQNPYEVIADNGGKAALAELGGTVTVSSGTADTAAAQIPSIQAAIQQKADAIVIAGNDPSALCP
ncbi:MAG: rhamnose transport system substrate-binding protein, partial [Frankiales bacterium]|nr:rhamnose transport system substrate-binding protein [Frankiales bacterium]